MDVTTMPDDQIAKFLSLLAPNAMAMQHALAWVTEHEQRSTGQVVRDLEKAGRIRRIPGAKNFPRYELNT